MPSFLTGVPRGAQPDWTEAEALRLPYLQLLTSKPVLYVCNVGESEAASGNAFCEAVAAQAAHENAAYVIVSAAIEAEISQLDSDDKTEFLAELGLEDTGLARLNQRRLRAA